MPLLNGSMALRPAPSQVLTIHWFSPQHVGIQEALTSESSHCHTLGLVMAEYPGASGTFAVLS